MERTGDVGDPGGAQNDYRLTVEGGAAVPTVELSKVLTGSDQTLTDDPQLADAHYQLGLCMLNEGESAEATDEPAAPASDTTRAAAATTAGDATAPAATTASASAQAAATEPMLGQPPGGCGPRGVRPVRHWMAS